MFRHQGMTTCDVTIDVLEGVCAPDDAVAAALPGG